MCYLAGEFLKQGKNVLYISLEMAEELIHERVEANLLDITTDEIKTLSKEQYLKGINALKKKTTGRFVAKEYPTSAGHVGHFRHLLKELKQKKKFKPDVVMVDYINICASSRYKSLSGVNSYSYVKAIAEELRGLAVEFDLPILTATQTNRDGSKESNPDMTSTSESFGLPATLDWYIAITMDEVLADNGQQLMHLLKTRWGNKSKIKPQLVNINFDKMRYTDVGMPNNDSVKKVQEVAGKGKKPKQKVSEIDWD
jgi:replicative DNA helicase